MEPSQHFLLFLLFVFTKHGTSGIPIKGRGRDPVDLNRYFSSENGRGEIIQSYDKARTFDPAYFDPVASSSQGIHPDLKYYSSDIFSSRSRASERDFSFHDSNYVLDTVSIMDELIENSPDARGPVKIEVQSMIDELINKAIPSNSYKSEILSNQIDFSNSDVIHQKKQGLKDSADFGIQSQEIQMTRTSNNLGKNHMHTNSVELVPKSGVLVNQKKLNEMIEFFKHYPRELIRRLIDEIIPANELATMQITDHGGYKPIPKNIVLAVEAFVSKHSKPQLTHQQFNKALNKHLQHLRVLLNIKKTHIREKKIQLYESLNTIG